MEMLTQLDAECAAREVEPDLLTRFKEAEAHAIEMERRANQANLAARNARREAERLREKVRAVIDPPVPKSSTPEVVIARAIAEESRRTDRRRRPRCSVCHDPRCMMPGGQH
jgi:hypothetical protein